MLSLSLSCSCSLTIRKQSYTADCINMNQSSDYSPGDDSKINITRCVTSYWLY